MTIKDLGEKKIIELIIRPLFNPKKRKELIGDDCAVISNPMSKICLSTDRVPSDLLAFKNGLINYYDLGYYLAVLNISDSAAAGSKPNSLLLNFAFPSNFLINDLESIFQGVKKACKKYKVKIIGGDLTDSTEISLSATIVGFTNNPLFRKGIKKKDLIFCSDIIGLTPTAFKYFFIAKNQGLKLTSKEEIILLKQFNSPKARVYLANQLSASKHNICCMDNTDGFGQSLKELAEINSLSINLKDELIPIHQITRKVASFLKMEALTLALEPGADFQLVGSISKTVTNKEIARLKVKIIGYADTGKGINLIKSKKSIPLNINGWNYYI